MVWWFGIVYVLVLVYGYVGLWVKWCGFDSFV